MTHTPESLLTAVGVDWQARPDLSEWKYGLPTKLGYTGPALDTPELDAILWVEGQRWLVNQSVIDKLDIDGYMTDAFSDNPFWEHELMFSETPGHALAKAIAEVTA
jgi:hypothetical protein